MVKEDTVHFSKTPQDRHCLLACNRKYRPKGPYILCTILCIWTNSTESFKRCIPCTCGNIQYLTCDHTTASVLYFFFFLQAFLTDPRKMYGNALFVRPVMIICDSSIVLLQAISSTFCRINLEDLLQRYYDIITGQHSTGKFDIPILHRCLSHIMKKSVKCKHR